MTRSGVPHGASCLSRRDLECTARLGLGALGRPSRASIDERIFAHALAALPDPKSAGEIIGVTARRNLESAATRHLGRALALEPCHFLPRAGLGLIRLRLGQEREALEAFETALAIDPHLSGVRRKAEALKAKLGGRQGLRRAAPGRWPKGAVR